MNYFIKSYKKQIKERFYFEILHVPDILSDFPGDENPTLEDASRI